MGLLNTVAFGQPTSQRLYVDPTGRTLPTMTVNKVYALDTATGNLIQAGAASRQLLGVYLGTEPNGFLVFEQQLQVQTAAFVAGSTYYLAAAGALTAVPGTVIFGVALDADRLLILASGNGDSGGGGGGAPVTSQYFLGAVDGALANGRLPTATATVSWDVATANQFKANVVDGSITDAKIRDSAALSVIGRSVNSSGDPADIAAGTDFHVLRRSGVTIGFGQVATGGVADEAITLIKIQQIATARLLGRSTAGAGIVELISIGTGLSLAAGVLSASGITGVTGLLDGDVPVSDGITGLIVKAGPLNVAATSAMKNTTGGNARGVGSIDFQTLRSANSDVASGVRAVLIGGQNSRAAGGDAGVYSSRASFGDAAESVIIGVNTGLITGGAGGYHFLGGGRDNTISAGFFQSAILAGVTNLLDFGSNSVILGGEEGNIQDSHSAVIAGYQNKITRAYTVAMGLQALADKIGMIAFGGGKISISGDRQSGLLTWNGSTPNATPLEITLLGQGGAYLTLINGDLYKLKISALAISTGGEYAVWDDLPVSIHRFSGTTATDVDIATVAPNWNSVGMSTARLAVQADDPNDRTAVTVTGIGATVKWLVFGIFQKVSLT